MATDTIFTLITNDGKADQFLISRTMTRMKVDYEKYRSDLNDPKKATTNMNELIKWIRKNNNIYRHIDIPIEHIEEVSQGFFWKLVGDVYVMTTTNSDEDEDEEIVGQMVIFYNKKYLIPYTYFHTYKIGNVYLLAAVIEYTRNE